MIKASELRVGNIICDSLGNIREVNGGDIFDQWWYEQDSKDGSLAAPLNPIELTTEWTVRMGFELVGKAWSPFEGINDAVDRYRYTNGSGADIEFEIIYTPAKEEFHRLITANEEFGYRDGRSLEYVHQLQNLYFFLTGEEVIVKL